MIENDDTRPSRRAGLWIAAAGYGMALVIVVLMFELALPVGG